MNEINTARTPHSIASLIYVEINERARGFKQELLSEEVTDKLQQFLFCPECKGIIREAIQSKGRTVCHNCSRDSSGDSDQNVQANVPILKCRCPLYIEGCDWSGELGSVKEHMNICLKLLVECDLRCGVVLERGEVVEHQKNICPTRMKPCEYCGQNIQAIKENKHTKVCLHHPESEVACPYKEVGCDTEGVLRKHIERHLAECTIVHHKLILAQFQQQQSRDKQATELNVLLRDRMQAMEQTLVRRKDRSISVWTLLFIFAILAAGISVLVWYQVENSERLEREIVKLGNELRRKDLEVETIIKASETETKTKLDLMRTSVAELESRLKQMEQMDLLKQLQTLSERLPPISRYFTERGKILEGVEWTHAWADTERIIAGPKFYLKGLCKLRLHAKFSRINGKFQPRYYVTRIIGDYEELVGRCHISYTYHFYENLETGTNTTMLGEYKSSDLEIDRLLYVHYFLYEIKFKRTRLIQNDQLTVKVYFDTEIIKPLLDI